MKKIINTPVTLQIEKISSKGFGVGFWQKPGSASPTKIFVPGALPGEEVLVEIVGKKKEGLVGKLQQVNVPAVSRRDCPCPHVPSCGGCSLQALSYEKQLEYKQALVKEAFDPLFSDEIKPIIPSEPIWHYRNKMEYTFSQNKEGIKFLGLIQAGSKGRVETVRECFISPLWFSAFLQQVLSWWEGTNLLAYNAVKNIGALRTLTLREGINTGHKMVILTVSGVPEFALTRAEIESFKNAVRASLEGDVSVFLRVQQAIAGQATQFYEMHLLGPAHIEEKLVISLPDYEREYRFKISPTAFFQPNTSQAERLYASALAMVGFERKKRVLDLYAGTATLGMVFAPFADEVVSIELNPYAVFDAQMNQEINGITNLRIVKGDVGKELQHLQNQDKEWINPDLVVIDPPRTGLFFDAIAGIISLAPDAILYISCAPKTQARDCLLLKEAGYSICGIQPLEQFPHTIHIENIVLLRKNK